MSRRDRTIEGWHVLLVLVLSIVGYVGWAVPSFETAVDERCSGYVDGVIVTPGYRHPYIPFGFDDAICGRWESSGRVADLPKEDSWFLKADLPTIVTLAGPMTILVTLRMGYMRLFAGGGPQTIGSVAPTTFKR